VVGYPPDFWQLALDGADRSGVIATQRVADELQLDTAARVVLRLPVLGALPRDSALGDKLDTTLAEPVVVDHVIAGEGFARFGIFATQQSPRTIFVPLAQLQQMMQQPGRANVLALATQTPLTPSSPAASEWLDQHFRPALEDYGLKLTSETAGGKSLFQLASSQLVISETQYEGLRKARPQAHWQEVTSYLANTIELGDAKVPYSLVTGVDSRIGLGPLLRDGQPLSIADDQVVLNDWLAERLGAGVGDTITFTYYEPESTHGELVAQRSPPLKVVAIVPLADAAGEPTAAADPKLVPELAGVTDEASINDWDVPFELTEPIDREDEEYWDNHRTTPKAFISAHLAQQLFASRWGRVSLLRIDSDTAVAAADLGPALDPELMGLKLLPAKAQALESAAGTTPFDGLFLGFSMFLIAAALMLLVIVMGLVLAGRYRELGTLLAMGHNRRSVSRLVGGELAVVICLGAMVGAAAGVAYAAVMIGLLTTVWVEAIAAPFVATHVTARSLLLGLGTGGALAGVVIWWTLRRVIARPAIELVGGRLDQQPNLARSATHGWAAKSALLASLALAIAMAGWGLVAQGTAQAGAFFGCGASLLAGLLLLVFGHLRSASTGRASTTLTSLGNLAWANLYRKPLASTLLMGLVGATAFMLFSVSAFRLVPTEQGVGGFDWIATSDQPILFDMGTASGQLELGFSTDDERRLEGVDFVSIRASDGESASCLHLFKPSQPRVLGVPTDQMAGSKFAWSSHAPVEPNASPWQLLDNPLPTGHVPCVLDANTALYSLQLYGGVGSTFTIRDGDNNQVTMQLVGMLDNSVLQGDVIVGEQAFRQLFPDVAGRRLFLIADRATDNAAALDVLLEDRLSDVGFDAVATRQRLAEFLAVQNTYLSTFQTLGGLGLILGTVGLAAVELRNLLARRGELTLMRACGYRRRRLSALVLLENLWLLLGGLAIGIAAAVVALVPPALTQQTSPPVGVALFMVSLVLVVGTLAAWIATRQIVRAPLVAALRGD
jgi:ABC-type antimicrobial peptide transport system permease subunit